MFFLFFFILFFVYFFYCYYFLFIIILVWAVVLLNNNVLIILVLPSMDHAPTHLHKIAVNKTTWAHHVEKPAAQLVNCVVEILCVM
jgi:hypothetical protein